MPNPASLAATLHGLAVIAAWLTPTITAGALLAHLFERNIHE